MKLVVKAFLLAVIGLGGMLVSVHGAVAMTKEDQETTQRFEKVSKQMFDQARTSSLTQDSKLSFEVKFIDAPVANAYAELNDQKCKVTVFTGLWDDKKGLIKRESDAEFAAIFGHELGHCFAKHQKFLEKTVSDKIKQLGYSGFQKGSNSYLELLSVNRGLENQADFLGIQLMEKAGFSPWAALDIWERAISRPGQGVSASYYKSHPSAQERAERIRSVLESSASPRIRTRPATAAVSS